MSGWDDSLPASNVADTGASWNPGFSLSAATGLVDVGEGDAAPDGAADNDGPREDTGCRHCGQEGHFARECPSKPANDGACFNCGEQGHNKSECPNPRAPPQGPCRICGTEGHYTRECPDKPENYGACFNCGEQGHNKNECPNPRVPNGPCRHCGIEGHFARECPQKPAEVCRHCGEEGHYTAECVNNRKIDRSHIKDRSAEEAWDLMAHANEIGDFDAFKEHMMEYMKAVPGTRFDEIESSIRSHGFNFYLFALEREIGFNECIVGPNGELDCKYIWSLNKSPRPRRSRAVAHRMAPTPEENLARLHFAGDIMPEVKPFCYNCKTKGHTRLKCETERPEDEFGRVVLQCTNCDSLNHRLRDCPEPRKAEVNYNACRNCGEEGHRGADCTVPRQADENTECRKCNGMGHFSKDCPERGAGNNECYNCGEQGHRSSDCTNEKVPKCRNCDERGHMAKECPKPRDITRVKCNNCGEMGHFSKGCTNPKLDADDGGADFQSPATYETAKESFTEPQVMGAWGAADLAITDPIGTWASNVVTSPDGGGW